ncbi:MAG: class I SAM-dependent methyltransferase [Pseudomonadota bacterium]|nr:class I SAM-dependent methyltransferase [Pseudomonadota bacterium]
MASNQKDFLIDSLKCISQTEEETSTDRRDKHNPPGLSGTQTIRALQNLCGLFREDPNVCYLEIGVFQGSSLLSVASAHPKIPCYGIDNFSILDPENQNYEILTDRIKNSGLSNITVINEDFEKTLLTLRQHISDLSIGLLFVDGAHDYRSQLLALLNSRQYLHINSIIVIDDANYEFVRQSTVDFLLACPEFALIYEAYTPAHPANLEPKILKSHERGWLNGVNIIAHDPMNLFERIVPPTNPDRTLYVNDWLIHRHKLAMLAPEALDYVYDIFHNKGLNKTELESILLEKQNNLIDPPTKLFVDRNTYSSNLTSGRYNKFV